MRRGRRAAAACEGSEDAGAIATGGVMWTVASRWLRRGQSAAATGRPVVRAGARSVKARASRHTSGRCPRPGVMRQEFDAYHVSARTRWTVAQGSTGESGIVVTIVLAEFISGSRARWYDLEQTPAFGESGFAAPVEEP